MARGILEYIGHSLSEVKLTKPLFIVYPHYNEIGVLLYSFANYGWTYLSRLKKIRGYLPLALVNNILSMPENTFRFEREGDGLRFYKLANPIEFTDSRFGALTTHLADLGLCGDFLVADHQPTPDGLRLLEAGEL